MEEKGREPSREELDAIDSTEAKLELMDMVPGLKIEMDPSEADMLGAFEEDALSLEDAQEASMDPREAP